MEEGADSRIVQTNANTESGWQVIHGPFEEYESFGESDWTLLVQSVNEWVPEVGEPATLSLSADWRLDDVMVSFSCENGGVGPHVDQYDVFIIQGAGKLTLARGQPSTVTGVATSLRIFAWSAMTLTSLLTKSSKAVTCCIFRQAAHTTA